MTRPLSTTLPQLIMLALGSVDSVGTAITAARESTVAASVGHLVGRAAPPAATASTAVATLEADGEADGACHLDEGFGFKDADLFGNPENTNSTATAEECCALCQQYAGIGCVFYQFTAAGCHPSYPSGCCRLKTAGAWNSRAPLSGAHSGSIKPLPPPPPPPPPDLKGSVVVFSAGLGGVPNYRIPAIVQTTGSPPALVAFAEARNGSDFTASRIAVRTSTSGGKTWSDVTFAAGMCSSLECIKEWVKQRFLTPLTVPCVPCRFPQFDGFASCLRQR
jgi:hypothetical protein